MKIQQAKRLSKSQFRRLTGIKRETFNSMVEIVRSTDENKKFKCGRRKSLGVENRILMMLKYWREYVTYLSVGSEFGLSESNAYQNIKQIEDLLIKSGKFSLPGKKALLKSDNQYEVILIDATETPIERPKKNNVSTTREKRKNIR
jgi:hypothetical protein